MILVGQYDSPFVRRVAVTLHLYGMPFTRNTLSVFSDAGEMARIIRWCASRRSSSIAARR